MSFLDPADIDNALQDIAAGLRPDPDVVGTDCWVCVLVDVVTNERVPRATGRG